MNSFSYTLNQLGLFCKARFVGVSKLASIKELLIDSRKAKNPNQLLFIAIKGIHHNGHVFIEELYSKGVLNFLISEANFDFGAFPKANFLIVDNSLLAFQQIAQHHRQHFNIPVIGITGSNGKTIVKEWLSSCLQPTMNVCKSPKSYNSQVGVPLSVLGLNATAEVALFEAGISQQNEMLHLQNIIQPNIGVFTNIGQAHSENFNSIAAKVKEKFVLFSDVEKLIYCKDYQEIERLVLSEFKGAVYAWSRQDTKAFIYIKQVLVCADKTTITLCNGGVEHVFNVPFKDEASIENSLHVIAVLFVLNTPFSTIQQNLNKLRPLAMRLELKEAKGNSLLINDAYSSDLDSLKIALDFLHQQSGNAKKIAILSDLDETGISKKELFPKLIQLLNRYKVEQVIGVGPHFKDFESIFPNGSCFASTDAFISNLPSFNFNDAAILLKGARRFRFEKIGTLLEQKVHETVLEVNLNAISDNFHFYKSKLRKETKVMVMVKAFSYGNGSYEIAHHLEYHNADYLAVAYVDEGIALHKKGIRIPIMVLNSDTSQFNQLIKNNLEPEIYSFRQLKVLHQGLLKTGRTAYPIHLKLDTGMRRLGFQMNEINQVIEWVSAQKEIKIASVFSHLASTKDVGFTQQQVQEFDAICTRISQTIKTPFLKHILNSSGILNFPEAQFDMVRLGIGLYGIGAEGLLNCSALKTVISQIKEVFPGESVGYNRSFYCETNMRIAIVPIGYADGLNRALSNGVGHFYINGSTAKIIGHICMDMCMVDVTNIHAQEGDQVIVWSAQRHINAIAKSLDTITYEVLTNVSQRVKRVFVKE